MKTKKLILFGLLLSCCFTANAQFQFVSSTPAANANAVANNANISLVFDANVDAATVTANNIVITGSQTGLIAGSFSGGGTTTIVFDPTTDFEPGEIIWVTLTAGLANTTGDPLSPTEQFEFRVASTPLPPPFSYTSQNITTSADAAISIHAADMDGDGDMDALSASFNDDKIAWYENDGTQNFTAHNITVTADGARSVHAADLDSDGDMDVLSASLIDDTIAWYENDGAQNFTAHTIALTADEPISVYAADMDGDGDMDALSASRLDDKIAWYENDGAQNFTAHNITVTADEALSVYAADIDGDGDMDALGASSLSDEIAWYENDGAQNFTAHSIAVTTDNPRSVYAADMDGDGDMDALSASNEDDTIAWYENDGNQVFTAHNITTSADGAQSVYATDMDGDGDMDVLSASQIDDTIAWYENDGAQNFAAHTIALTVDAAISVYAADMDGDGDMDALGASRFGDSIAWYEFSGADYIYENNAWMPSDPSGVSTLSDNVLVVNGTASLTSDTQLNMLAINPGATLNIEQVLTANGDIENNGSLVFVSDGTKLGQLGDMTGLSITGTGNVSVQRYYPARRAFRFVSSAVTTATSIHDNWQEGATGNTNDPNPGFGTHITGSTTDQQNGFDGSITGNPSLFLYDNTAQTWGSIANTDVNVVEAGEAYRLMIRGGRNIDLTDNATTSTNTVLRATGANADFVIGDYSATGLGQNAGDFNFIGNPYQAIVDMNSVLANSTNLNPNFYYVWDPTLGGTPTPGQPGGRGAYVTVSLPLGTNPSGSDANEFLQPGQAAFVVTATAGTASILFGEADKAPFEIPTAVFKPSNSTAFINLQLYGKQSFLNGGTVSDALRVNFSQNGNNAVNLYDAPKRGNLDENICLMNGNDYLSIENRALPIAGEMLPLFTDRYRHSDYVFQIEVNGLNNVTAYLNDAYLGTQTQLSSGMNQIAFSVDQSIDASIATDRFSITFGSLSIEEETLYGFALYPNPTADGAFTITAPGLAGKEVRVSLHDLLGRRVYNAQMNVGADNRIEVQAGKLQSGVYMVRLDMEEGKSFTKKLIVE